MEVNLPALLALDAQVTSAHGLKAIAPMTESPQLINYVLGRPDADRVGKVLLKTAMHGLLPKEIITRKDKRGFPVPYVEWAQGPLRDFIGDRIGYVPDPRSRGTASGGTTCAQGRRRSYEPPPSSGRRIRSEGRTRR